MLKRRFFFVSLLGIILSPLSQALAFHDLNDIHNQVNKEVTSYLTSIYGEQDFKDDIAVTLGNLDPRLTLPLCSDALEVSIKESAYGRQKLNAKVHCPNGARWTIYVAAKIDIFREVAIINRNVHKGEIITLSDFTFNRTNTSNIGQNYIESPALVIGKEARRQIRSGNIIKSQDLRNPILVKKGDIVVVTALAGALRVSTEGTALTPGQLGEQIRIRNSRSKRVIDARVTGSGQAEVASR